MLKNISLKGVQNVLIINVSSNSSSNLGLALMKPVQDWRLDEHIQL